LLLATEDILLRWSFGGQAEDTEIYKITAVFTIRQGQIQTISPDVKDKKAELEGL